MFLLRAKYFLFQQESNYSKQSLSLNNNLSLCGCFFFVCFLFFGFQICFYHFVNFAVELLFEFLYSHLHSGFSKTTGANCRWILLQSQTDTSASGYMSLIFKDDQQQQDLCPGVQEQRASMNSEGTYRLCYFHLSTQSRPPFQLHFRSFNTDFSYLHLGII